MSESPTPPAYTVLDDGAAIRCHSCDRVSHNAADVGARYCAHCKVFHDDPLVIPADVRAIVDQIMLDARALIANGGSVEPELILVRRTDGACWPRRMNLADPASRKAMIEATRLQADEHDADLVLLVSEAYLKPPGCTEEIAALCERYGAIDNIPGIKIGLLITIETPHNYWMGMSKISGHGASRRCAEMVYHTDFVARGGTYVRFLATPAERAERAVTLATVAQLMVDKDLNPNRLADDELGVERPLLDMLRRTMVRNRVSTIPLERLAQAVSLLRKIL